MSKSFTALFVVDMALMSICISAVVLVLRGSRARIAIPLQLLLIGLAIELIAGVIASMAMNGTFWEPWMRVTGRLIEGGGIMQLLLVVTSRPKNGEPPNTILNPLLSGEHRLPTSQR